MKLSKILILIFTLTFPVILYLFLTFYGSNEFDLPVFFESKNELCEDFVQLENITDTLTTAAGTDFLLRDILIGNINIISFPDLDEDNQQLKNELNRLMLTFSDEEKVKAHAFYTNEPGGAPAFLINDDGDFSNYYVENSFYNSLIDCYLTLPTQKWKEVHPAEMLLDKHKTLVLIDKDAHIRGYYDGLETKDVDRLILEIRILLTKQMK